MLPTFALILVQNHDQGWRNVLSFLAGFSLVFILLLAYSLGFAVPFFLFTAVWRSYLTKLPAVYRFLPHLQKVSGVVLILLGILLWRNDLVRIIL